MFPIRSYCDLRGLTISLQPKAAVFLLLGQPWGKHWADSSEATHLLTVSLSGQSATVQWRRFWWLQPLWCCLRKAVALRHSTVTCVERGNTAFPAVLSPVPRKSWNHPVFRPLPPSSFLTTPFGSFAMGRVKTPHPLVQVLLVAFKYVRQHCHSSYQRHQGLWQKVGRAVIRARAGWAQAGCGYRNGEKRMCLGDFMEVGWAVLIGWLDVEDERDRGRRNDAEISGLVSFIQVGPVTRWEAEREDGPQKTVSVVLGALGLRSLWTIHSKPTGGCFSRSGKPGLKVYVWGSLILSEMAIEDIRAREINELHRMGSRGWGGIWGTWMLQERAHEDRPMEKIEKQDQSDRRTRRLRHQREERVWLLKGDQIGNGPKVILWFRRQWV